MRAAAEYFQIPSVFVNGPGDEFVLHSFAAAELVNRLLPCGAEYVSATKQRAVHQRAVQADRPLGAGGGTHRLRQRGRHHGAGELHHQQRQDHALARAPSQPGDNRTTRPARRLEPGPRRRPAPTPSRRGRKQRRPARDANGADHAGDRARERNRGRARRSERAVARRATPRGTTPGTRPLRFEGDGGDGSVQSARHPPFGDRRRDPRRIPHVRYSATTRITTAAHRSRHGGSRRCRRPTR